MEIYHEAYPLHFLSSAEKRSIFGLLQEIDFRDVKLKEIVEFLDFEEVYILPVRSSCHRIHRISLEISERDNLYLANK